jgi:hypothetical protein
LVRWEQSLSGGAWIPFGGGGGGDWAATLVLGNITGPTDPVISSGQSVRGVDAAGGSGGAGTNLQIRPGNGDGAGLDGAIVVPSEPASVAGNARGENAIDLQRVRTGATMVASGARSFLIGRNNINAQVDGFVAGRSNTLGAGYTGNPSAVFGRQNVMAYGQPGWLVGGQFNDVLYGGYGGYGSTVFGDSNTFYAGAGGYFFASHMQGIGNEVFAGFFAQTSILGGYGNDFLTFGLSEHSIVWGRLHRITEAFASFVAGFGNTVLNADEAMVTGGGHVFDALRGSAATGRQCWSTNQGELLFGGGHSVLGDLNVGHAQTGRVSMAARTTDATTREFGTSTTDTAAAAFSRWVLRPDSTVTVMIEITARQTAGAAGTVGDSASWWFKGQIKRTGAVTTLVNIHCLHEHDLLLNPVGNVVGLIYESAVAAQTPSRSDAAAATWTVLVDANDANETLRLRATGQLNKIILWGANLHTAEAGNGVLP